MQGRILFWHDWDGEDTAVLNELIDGFHALHPEVRVVTIAVPSGMLRQRYEETASLGLGPDLLILSDADVRPFADTNLIRPLLDEEINAEKFLSTALDSLRYQDALYGLPLSLRPVALYYNAEQVEQPARTLEVLLQQAEAGQNVALNSQFTTSLWGISTFGGTLFNDEGQVVLDQGGFTNWLNWLKTAQEIPGITLDRNDATLRDLFVSERVAYYVGGPQALPDLRERMGEAKVRATSLPAGPNGPSGPLLQVEAILFNQASSEQQAELALALADYLTNAEQNARLMRGTDRVPANRLVRVDQQLFPVIAGFIAQARTAVTVPQLTQMDTLIAEGDDMLRGVLTGLVDVNEAAQQLAQSVNDPSGLNPPPDLPLVADCDTAGAITIGHTWRGAAAAALTQVATDFMAQCAETSIQLVQFTPAALLTLLYEGNGGEPVPDLILGPSVWAAGLTNNGLIATLNGRVDADLLQQFVAVALNTVEVDGQLIGLPVNLNLSALYYNGDVISDPATTLGDLLIEASEGNKVAIPLGFENAYWGVSSFDGTLFDNNSQLTPTNSGFIEWLTWLQQEQSQPGMLLSEDDAILQALFSSGAVVYYTGSSLRLNTLQTALGADTVRVTELPAGPNGAAAPLLSTDIFYLSGTSTRAKSDLALAFSLFATDVDAQTTFMTQAQIIPANINVDSSGHPAVAGFLAQAQTAVSWPQGVQVERVREQGNQLYESVVLRQLSPAQVACDLQININTANGFAIDEIELPDICRDETEPVIDE
ncbi:MAG: hypothetical protein DHS20C20_04890 [Ardenticatenaceae bacterium]|nr:MAG: hypothetical protein DHS20C20_04890 [Ardenticatenaceae bacterium]